MADPTENVEVKYTYLEGQGASETGNVNVDVVFTLDETTNTVTGVVRGTRTVGGTVYQITGLAPLGTDGSDNSFVLSQTGTYVDTNGITFVTTDQRADGTVSYGPATGPDVNLYKDGARDAEDNITEGPTFAVTAAVVCFDTGTLIRTTRGDVAVETLRIGDLAVTASGEHRPIRWLGHRTIDCRSHPRADLVLPVRIAAHAFGDNRPARDLLVSPGHALCVDVVDEVLIMAAALVNGSTVIQEDVDQVTYWHVELDSHDIIMAENMAAESYLDMGNRTFFTENEVVELDALPDAAERTHDDFCRPFHHDGALVDIVRAQLAARAKRLGWRHEEQGLRDLHLLVDGIRHEPRVRGLVARFTVPAQAKDVWLVSPSLVPATSSGWPDNRRLGVCLKGLEVDDGFGTPQAVEVDDPRLCVGFHAVEGDGDVIWRWTAGRGRLPDSLWEGIDGEFVLRVRMAGPMLARWVPPIAASAHRDRPLALAG